MRWVSLAPHTTSAARVRFVRVGCASRVVVCRAMALLSAMRTRLQASRQGAVSHGSCATSLVCVWPIQTAPWVASVKKMRGARKQVNFAVEAIVTRLQGELHAPQHFSVRLMNDVTSRLGSAFPTREDVAIAPNFLNFVVKRVLSVTARVITVCDFRLSNATMKTPQRCVVETKNVRKADAFNASKTVIVARAHLATLTVEPVTLYSTDATSTKTVLEKNDACRRPMSAWSRSV
jgi:hypothetical protein